MPRAAGRYGNRAGSSGEMTVFGQRTMKFRFVRAPFTLLGLKLTGRPRGTATCVPAGRGKREGCAN